MKKCCKKRGYHQKSITRSWRVWPSTPLWRLSQFRTISHSPCHKMFPRKKLLLHPQSCTGFKYTFYIKSVFEPIFICRNTSPKSPVKVLSESVRSNKNAKVNISSKKRKISCSDFESEPEVIAEPIPEVVPEDSDAGNKIESFCFI